MIYKCEHCGAPFDSEKLKKAIKEREPFMHCNYCQSNTQLSDIRASDIFIGYEHLSRSKFHDAATSFSLAIKKARDRGLRVSSDAYLGAALAQFHVETIFMDDDKIDFPKLVCHVRNNNYFSESEMFRNAMNTARDAEDRARLNSYADEIDSIKLEYDKIEAETQGRYNVFIAYEDNPQDEISERGYQCAINLYNETINVFQKSKKKFKLYYPSLKERGYERNYREEAKILYAIDHSDCMVVVVDNDIDMRLKSMIYRFFEKHGNKGDKMGFVLLGTDNAITLPDDTFARNVFEMGDDQLFHFIGACNGVIPPSRKQSAGQPEEVKEDPMEELAISSTVNPGNGIYFGWYPQTREKSEEVLTFFNNLPQPSKTENNGWKEWYKNASGAVCAWYRDELYKGRLYRAVYYRTLRKGCFQKLNGYEGTKVIYCFRFEPIEWVQVKKLNRASVLISKYGLDSRGFHEGDPCAPWDVSQLRDWMNGEFIDVAFNEGERNRLVTNAYDDEVSVPDYREDKEYYKNSYNLGYTDYFKCVGGAIDTDGGINKYWIVDNMEDGSAQVVYSNTGSVYSEELECPSVCILPKIIISDE